jgi:hypothetical protein
MLRNVDMNILWTISSTAMMNNLGSVWEVANLVRTAFSDCARLVDCWGSSEGRLTTCPLAPNLLLSENPPYCHGYLDGKRLNRVDYDISVAPSKFLYYQYLGYDEHLYL